MSDNRPADAVIMAIPGNQPDIIEWAERNVKFPKSARSKDFKISVTPWLREPMERATDLRTRIITLMKPVQSGGSVFGEILIMFWIMFARGMMQYNWSNDKRAKDRWNSRIRDILESNELINARMKLLDVREREIDFGNVFFRMQGAFTPDNLDSDSIALQVNEEVHSWEPGHLKKARGRSTAVWNFKSVDISNAGDAGDQLDQAFKDGTGQHWNVRCPGCGKLHRMRTKWEDDKPQLGGLRYDADGCRRGHMDYDYNKLRSTIQFQMPCGFRVHNEDIAMRRQMSLGGQYEEPQHTGAELTHRSYTYQAVIVDYIDWMTLIKEKHSALKARALGDPEPWRRYTQERECIPYSADDIPIINSIKLSELKISPAGLPEPRLRVFALDRQAGEKSKGELPHWWLVVRDFKVFFGALKSRLVFEGMLETDDQVVAKLDELGCQRHHGCADSGDDTDHVYNFCMRNGINAIKGGKEQWYVHEGGARRTYSPERPLHSMLNYPPKYKYVESTINNGVVETEPDPREPLFWLYSKGAIRERLHYIRSNTDYEIPADVSENYKEHNDAEERVKRQHPRTGEDIVEWIQRKRRNDLFVCECYAAMILDMSGALGECQVSEVETTNQTK
jgi:hypothetical protein